MLTFAGNSPLDIVPAAAGFGQDTRSSSARSFAASTASPNITSHNPSRNTAATVVGHKAVSNSPESGLQAVIGLLTSTPCQFLPYNLNELDLKRFN